LIALPRPEAFAIKAFRPAEIIRDANQAVPSCQQDLDLTGAMADLNYTKRLARFAPISVIR
jgi:hypothetical protein